jgi:hypothetical protein
MAPTPHWCPPGITPNQRRRIQQMRVQKMRDKAVEKGIDEHFNTIQLVIPMKQEWRVKEKVDDMDLLDDDEAPLIKDRSPPPTGMDMNMVFMLQTEFRGVEEEVAEMFLNPKGAVIEKPKGSSQHLKTLYIQGHINGKPISSMLINSGAAVNLMLYAMFKKLG